MFCDYQLEYDVIENNMFEEEEFLCLDQFVQELMGDGWIGLQVQLCGKVMIGLEQFVEDLQGDQYNGCDMNGIVRFFVMNYVIVFLFCCYYLFGCLLRFYEDGVELVSYRLNRCVVF